MSYKKNYIIAPHIHKKRLSKITLTTEVLLLQKGILRVDFYSDSKKYMYSKKLYANDLIIMSKGGHGFKVLKDIEMIEVKQGPYTLSMDKVRFDKINEKKLNLNKKFIPVSIPHISKQDIQSVSRVLQKGWISSNGPDIKFFEKNFRKN